MRVLEFQTYFLLLTTWNPAFSTYRGYRNSRLFYMTTPGIPGIPDFFTHEHLEGVGIPDFFVRIVLEFQDFFLSTARGIPDIFVKTVLEFHLFMWGKNYPLWGGGSDVIWNSPLNYAQLQATISSPLMHRL